MAEQDSNAFKNWWLLGIKGLLIVLFGVVALTLREINQIKIVKYFGIILLTSGLLLTIGAFINRKTKPYYRWWFSEGVFDIIIGLLIVYLLNYRRIEAMANYTEIIAIWALFLGVILIFTSFKYRNLSINWLAILISGILSIGYTITIVAHFMFSLNTLPGLSAKKTFIGFFAILLGAIIIYNSTNLFLKTRNKEN